MTDQKKPRPGPHAAGPAGAGWRRWVAGLSPQRPWLHLAYLGFLLFPWTLQTPERAEVLLTVAAVAVFLGVYVIAMWRRDRTALVGATISLVIGLALMPINFAASVFLVYAAAMLGRMRVARERWVGLGVWAVAAPAGALWIGMPPGYLAAVLAFGVMVAAASAWAGTQEDRDAEAEDREALAASLAADAERQRIARDLHDLLGHTLSLVTLKADLANRLFDADPERARAEIRAIETISRNALGEVREAVTGLRQRSLTDEAREAMGQLQAAGLATRIDLGAAIVPARAEAGLAMVVREGVTNILRHAAAKRAELVLDGDQGCGRLTLRDDGLGGARFQGRGLDGLRERLEDIGLQLSLVDGLEGRGTGLQVHWEETAC
ncbi:sensor histidine kinase [Maricaulis sp. CAU 1757]